MKKVAKRLDWSYFAGRHYEDAAAGLKTPQHPKSVFLFPPVRPTFSSKMDFDRNNFEEDGLPRLMKVLALKPDFIAIDLELTGLHEFRDSQHKLDTYISPHPTCSNSVTAIPKFHYSPSHQLR